MNYVRSNGSSLKYQRFASSGCKDIGIRQFEFVAKTQFLYTDRICFIFVKYAFHFKLPDLTQPLKIIKLRLMKIIKKSCVSICSHAREEGGLIEISRFYNTF